MGETTAISWCDHTFNIVWGCEKISPACKFCYAADYSLMRGFTGKPNDAGDIKPLLWGPGSERRILSEHYWNDPLRWNRKALAEFGRPARVFCSSMADVFENHPVVNAQRDRLWDVIERTPYLIWLLLTKRPENIELPANFESIKRRIWWGVTVEDPAYVWRIPELMAHVPWAPVIWVSAEPLLEPLKLRPWLSKPGGRGVSWVIAGGESGPNARPMLATWPMDLLLDCKRAGAAFHLKQLGDWLAKQMRCSKSGKNPLEWPRGWRIQEFPA